jgi:hypothetical protein
LLGNAVLTKDMMRDARRLLGWSARELGERVGLRGETVLRLETGTLDLEKTAYGKVVGIIRALETGGIEFLPDGSVRRRPAERKE